MYKKINNARVYSNFTRLKFPINTSNVERKKGSFTTNIFSIDKSATYKTFFLKNNKPLNFTFKDIFYKRLSKIKVKNNLSSKIIDSKGFLSYVKIFEVSGNDIVQGLPKLESLLESSIEPASYNYIDFSLGVPIQNKKNVFITSFDTHFINCNAEPIVLIPKYNSKERKDPEVSCWFHFATLNSRFNLEKTLLYNRLKFKSFIVNSLQRIYKEQNITVARKIFESVINVMFSRILIINPLYNPFLHDETINFKIYLKILQTTTRLKKLPLIGLPIIDGISKSVKTSDRVLSSLSFKDTLNDLTKRTLFGSKDWLTSTKSNLILGQKIRIGSNLKDITDIYFSTKNLMLKNNYFN